MSEAWLVVGLGNPGPPDPCGPDNPACYDSEGKEIL